MTNSYTYSDDRLTDINVNGGTRYQFTYDAFGRTTYTKVGNGLAYRNLSQLIYNGNGLLTRQNYGNGDYITFSYDSLDRLIGKSYNGSSTDKVEYFYGADGNISKTIDYSTNTRTKYVYDLAGRLVSTRDYKNDKSDNEGLKAFVEYTYADKTNYLTGIKHYNALGTQNIGYRYGDIANGEMPDQIYGVTWNGDEKVNYTYDSLGRLTNKAINGIDTTYTYVDVDDTKTTTLLSSMTTEGLTHNYSYDELGNITAIGLNEENINSYEYDALNQLIRSGDRLQNKTYTYEYINGNIKYVHEYDYTTGTLPETPLKTTEYHYDDEVWSDVLTGVSQYSYNTSNVSTYGLRNNSTSSIEEYARSILGDDLGNYEIVDFGSKALLSPQSESSGSSTYSLPRSTNLDYTYSVESDEIGNITNIDGIQIEWNGRRAERAQKGDAVVTYEYNIDGQRVSKTVNGVKTEYFYNGEILAGQKTGNDTVIFMYDNNGDIFGFNYNGEEYYYVKNAQNDVVLVLNSDRTAAVIYLYDAWGNITGALDLSADRISNINPITYRSYYYDIEMGVYYLNSRYYAPLICRFMSADGYVQTGQGMLDKNMFAYCANNPVNYVDPNGDCYYGANGAWCHDKWENYGGYVKKPDPRLSKTASLSGQKLIKNYDSIIGSNGEPHLEAYYDIYGVKTIGWGHTGQMNPKNVKDSITLDEAEILFQQDLSVVTRKANRLIIAYDLDLTQQQYDAAVMYGFQHGPNGTGPKSMYTLMTAMNINDVDTVRSILSGSGRREDEYELYAYGDYVRNH